MLPQEIAADADASDKGEEVLSKARSLFFRSTNIRRLWDREKNTIVYVSYSKRLDKENDPYLSRFRLSMCSVKVDYVRVPSPTPASPR